MMHSACLEKLKYTASSFMYKEKAHNYQIVGYELGKGDEIKIL